MADDFKEWLMPVVAIAKKAGDAALKYVGLSAEKMNVSYKADRTVVTDADRITHDIIQQSLQTLTPNVPVLSEEDEIPAWELRKKWSRYWLVDPIDGTRGFVDQCPEFTVNIALIENHQVILGVVYAPALKLCYSAAKNQGAFKQIDDQSQMAIKAKKLDWKAFQVLLGRYLYSPKLPNLFGSIPGCELIRLNSSLKFCWIAEGKGDFYPRFGQTSEWDTAAAQCVLTEAGGAVVDFEGKELQYNAQESLVNPAFVAVGHAQQALSIIEFIQEKRGEK